MTTKLAEAELNDDVFDEFFDDDDDSPADQAKG